MQTQGKSLHSIQRIYTALAPWYDVLVPFISVRSRTLGLHWLDVQDGERVLDVGTGTGLAFESLLDRNPNGWTDGVDATPAMLARARRRAARHEHDRYTLQQGHATSLPYEAQTFDALFASYLIDVIPAEGRRAALNEMRRVLKPGGRLVLVHLGPPKRSVERLWITLSNACPLLLGGAQPIEIEPLLRQSNFSLCRRTSCVQLGLRSAIVEAICQ